LYLWQIRHIPNIWQNLFKFTSVVGAGGLILLLGCFTFSHTLFGQTAAEKQKASSDAAAKPVADSAGAKAAAEFVQKVRQSLGEHSSVQADIEQTVSIGTQQFVATGRYVSSGPKLRLEYNIKPDQGISGSLLEVCDGKELWSLIKVADSKRVTHRDVQQIKAAASSERAIPDAVLTAELGLGGLSALFASLERTMVFDAMKQETSGDRSRTVVQGKWKPEIRSRWPQGSDESLPAYVPDMVRIVVDSATMFPERIVYIKRLVEKDKKVNRALVDLQFSKVTFDSAIDDQEFTFVTPDDVVPEDITRQYLDRLKKSAESPAGKETAPTGSPANATGR
jgi:outer membrane lipoprotein-sorting protein